MNAPSDTLCANCDEPIRATIIETPGPHCGAVIWAHHTHGMHTVCNWVDGMSAATTGALPVATPLFCMCEDTYLVPGVIHGDPYGKIIENIEACADCERFPGDLEAAMALAAVTGGEVWFDQMDNADDAFDDEFSPTEMRYTGGEIDGYICTGTDPWIVLTPITPTEMADKRRRLLALAADLAP